MQWTGGAGAHWGMFAGSRHPAGRPSFFAAPPAIANRCRVVEHHLAEERSPRVPGGDRAARDILAAAR
eukprot:scaffold8650_cov32-Phaeocystis_antarctica.AAC.1